MALVNKGSRPDIDAAVRGGDWSQSMDGEGALADANVEQAIYWRQIYRDILKMEESVLARIRELMAKQSAQARREVELTNVPVVVAQAERFRQRLGYWEARVHELNGSSREVTSDQAPGEDVVQVNDRYAGGGPPPELEESEHGQHQTGG
jgi:hypothetical protein